MNKSWNYIWMFNKMPLQNIKTFFWCTFSRLTLSLTHSLVWTPSGVPHPGIERAGARSPSGSVGNLATASRGRDLEGRSRRFTAVWISGLSGPFSVKITTGRDEIHAVTDGWKSAKRAPGENRPPSPDLAEKPAQKTDKNPSSPSFWKTARVRRQKVLKRYGRLTAAPAAFRERV